MQVCKALRHASDGQGMQFCKACISMCGYVRCRTYHKHAKRHTKRHTERQRHTHHTCGVSHLHPPFRNDLVNPVVMLRGTLEPLETVRHTTRPTVSYAVQAQDTSSCQSYTACWCGLQLRFKPVPKGTASPKGFTVSPKGILSLWGRGALPPAQGSRALCHHVGA